MPRVGLEGSRHEDVFGGWTVWSMRGGRVKWEMGQSG